MTGVAGLGRHAEKPVGLVYLHASTPRAEEAMELHLRETGPRWTACSRPALHLLRRVLAQSRHTQA